MWELQRSNQSRKLNQLGCNPLGFTLKKHFKTENLIVHAKENGHA